MKNIMQKYFLISCLVLIFSSCDYNSENPKIRLLKIENIIDGSEYVFTHDKWNRISNIEATSRVRGTLYKRYYYFTYDNQNRLASFRVLDADFEEKYEEFVYKENTILIYNVDAIYKVPRITIILDRKKMPTEISGWYVEKENTSFSERDVTYIYDKSNNLMEIALVDESNRRSKVVYEYGNENSLPAIGGIPQWFWIYVDDRKLNRLDKFFRSRNILSEYFEDCGLRDGQIQSRYKTLETFVYKYDEGYPVEIKSNTPTNHVEPLDLTIFYEKY